MLRRILSALVKGRSTGACAFFLLGGVLLLIAAGAGTADALKHGRRDIGTGAVYERFIDRFCSRRVCTPSKAVHVRIDRARRFTTAADDGLYDLVGPGDRVLPARLEVDTFSGRLSRAEVAGRSFVLYDNGYTTFFITGPLLALGLLIVVLNAGPVVRASGRGLVAQRLRRRWALIVGGAALAGFCALLSWVGLTGATYDAGGGKLFDRFATYDSGGYHEGAHVLVDGDGTTAEPESAELYDLLEADGASLPVQVREDDAGEVASVSFHGTSYAIQPPNWYPLLVVVPLALLGLATALLNWRALRSGRR